MSRALGLLTGLLVLATGVAVPPPAAADLPRVHIDHRRAIPDDPKVPARMRVTGDGRVVRSRIGIEVRGHSSQWFPKKSFALETRAADGENRDVALLGMPEENDWILYAAYNDKTLMRNVLAYETARWMGRYASRTRYVELWRNGRYQGIYVLMESLKLDGERVDLEDEGVSGAYLLELTFDFQARGEPKLRLPVTRRPLLYEDPERGDLSRREVRWLRGHVARAERALYGSRSRSRDRGWRRWLDEAAAVDYVLLAELFKNEDAFHASTYLSKGSGSKLALGPVWDFDVSSGNSNYGPSRFLRGWVSAKRPWAERLHRDPGFRRALAARWRELRGRGLAARLRGGIDRNVTELRGALTSNFRRWPVLGRYVWPNPVDPRTGRHRRTYRAEVAHLERWLARRIAWLDRRFGA